VEPGVSDAPRTKIASSGSLLTRIQHSLKAKKKVKVKEIIKRREYDGTTEAAIERLNSVQDEWRLKSKRQTTRRSERARHRREETADEIACGGGENGQCHPRRLAASAYQQRALNARDKACVLRGARQWGAKQSGCRATRVFLASFA
jgi:hypothetical protein